MDNITELWKSIVRLAVKQARQVTDDKEALAIKVLYKQWIAQLGRTLEVGEYIQHDGELYRVLQQHVVQGNWVPGIGTESLYMIIDKEHAGTLDDPIPWRGNMECFLGKYYIEDGILYECIRDSGIALHHKVTELIDNYFIIYNENIEEDDNIENGDNENIEDENGGENNNNNDENTEGGNEEGDNNEGEIVEPDDNPDINNGENEDSTEGGDGDTNDENIENGDENTEDGNENGEEDNNNEEDEPIIPEDNPNVDNGENEENTEGENENIEPPIDNEEPKDEEESDGEQQEPEQPIEPEEGTEIGTLENPIDVTNATLPITYELDKYYKEGEVVYKCTRPETLHFLPSSLVGHYFEIA